MVALRSAGRGWRLAPVIDVREADKVLTRISQAQSSFEEGVGVPTAVHDLLVELDGAIVDSGPLELGVSPDEWLCIQTRMRRSLESLNDASAEESVARARKALRQLQRLFKRGRRLRRWRARCNDARWIPSALLGCYLAILAGTIWLVGSHPHGKPAAILFAVALIVAWLALLFVFIGAAQHATIAAGDRKLAAMHAPEERWLFASRLPRRQLVIVTDQRLLAVSAPLRLRRSQPLWSLPYARVTSVTPAKHANARSVRLHAGEDSQRVEWRWSTLGESGNSDHYKDEQQALVTIVRRRRASLPRGG
jgi:hypothetical protein